MKKAKLLLVLLSVVFMVFQAKGQSPTDTEITYAINYKLTGEVVSVYDSLVQISVIVKVPDINKVKKVTIRAVDQKTLKDKLKLSMNISDTELLKAGKVKITGSSITFNIGIQIGRASCRERV